MGARTRKRLNFSSEETVMIRFENVVKAYARTARPAGRADRAAECDGLENRCAVTPHQGFESLALRRGAAA